MPGYLARRGFDQEVLRRWQVGYAPASRDALLRELRLAGYPDSLIEAAGLVRRTRAGLLADTFRDRLVLLIRDTSGRIVGFIGRAPERAGAAGPKYLNSPTTALYRKGEVLFGLWEARIALAAGAVPVITEGPLDTMAIATAAKGRYAPVAICGTVLTERQVSALASAGDLRATGVLVAFDQDGGGLRAAVRAYRTLGTVRTAAVAFPAGADPARILADHGPGTLASLLRQRHKPLADHVIDAEVGAWSERLRFAEGQVGALRTGAAVIAAMPARDVPRQVSRLAALIGLDHATVTEAVTDALSQFHSSPGCRTRDAGH